MSIVELQKQIKDIDKELASWKKKKRELQAELRGVNILSELKICTNNVTNLRVYVECEVEEPAEYTCYIDGFVKISYNYGDDIYVEGNVNYTYNQTYQTREFPNIYVTLNGNVTGIDKDSYEIGEYYIEDYEETGWNKVVNDILEFFYNGGGWNNLHNYLIYNTDK